MVNLVQLTSTIHTKFHTVFSCKLFKLLILVRLYFQHFGCILLTRLMQTKKQHEYTYADKVHGPTNQQATCNLDVMPTLLYNAMKF